MSKSLAILLGVALVWLTAWAIAGFYMNRAGGEMVSQSEYVGTRATRLERGADVRVEGTIAQGDGAMAPYSHKECLAAVTDIALTTVYRDIHDRDVHESYPIATRRVGPPSIGITVGDERLELPLERWSPHHPWVEETDALPSRLEVTADELASARAHLQKGWTSHYSISETTIDGGTHVFVVGRLENRDGALRLEADRVLGRIELYAGSQADFVKEMRGSGGGLRVAGLILGAGLGPLPLAIIGLVLYVRRRRGRAP